MYVCIYIDRYSHAHTYICIYIYIYTHVHMHIYQKPLEHGLLKRSAREAFLSMLQVGVQRFGSRII